MTKAGPFSVRDLPPFDAAAEEAVIAALVLGGGEAVEEVRDLLVVGDFFREQHGWLYAACLGIHERGEEITLVTVCHEMERMGRIQEMDELHIFAIVERHFTWQGVSAHARIVARDALYRRLIQAAGIIAGMAYEGGPEPDRVVAASRDVLERALSRANSPLPHNVTPIYEREEYRWTDV